MQGHFRSVLRLRVSKHEPPPLYSLSRGGRVRIFAAMPVIVRDQVAGVIYASRTPSNVMQHLYEERHKVGLAALCMLILTFALGVLFHRILTGPIRELVARTHAIARGDRQAMRPLSRHGTQEIAALTQAFLDMAGSLASRSDYIATFAAHVSHELKSPLTSILGAAELLRDDLEAGHDKMEVTFKERFLDNIISDTQRLTAIVNRLRELAQAEARPTAGCTSLQEVLAALRVSFPDLLFSTSGDVSQALAISAENLRIIIAHLADNAVRHCATTLTISMKHDMKSAQITVSDNGTGISLNNQAKIFDHFFTTRRGKGGTGMGLPIARAMLIAHGGSIELVAGMSKATFLLILPLFISHSQ